MGRRPPTHRDPRPRASEYPAFERLGLDVPERVVSGLQIAYLAILSTCILSSGFFSGSETALVSVPKERVAQLDPEQRRVRRLNALLSDPDAMLSTLLVANNFVNILAASVATVLFVELVGEDWGPWAATVSLTSVILVVGEITPKSLATRMPDRFALAVAPAIWRVSRIIRPVSRLFVAVSRTLFWFALKPGSGDQAAVTEEDIRAMALLGERTGDIEAAERKIIHALFALADLPVRDVMTPRTDIHSLESPVTFDAVRTLVAATGHSRFPVIKEDLDQLRGVLHVKDLLALQSDPSTSDIHRMIRPPVLVPESKSVLDLLLEMRANRVTFAVVTDEHGGVEGIVTITDALSELVGEIHDEHDEGAPSIVRVGPDRWLVDGRTDIEEAEEAVGGALPRGEYATIGGLILALAGRIPAIGDGVDTDGYRLEVLAMDRNRVVEVAITRR
jgi:putative hemolysin